METIIVSFSDPHCASPMGLLPPGQIQLQTGNFKQNKIQRLTWKMFDKHTAAIGEMRKDAKLIVVAAGDITEGTHHDNKQVLSNYATDQQQIGIAVIDHALSNMKFKAGDKLFFLRGTNSHGGENEAAIARDFGAEAYRKDSGKLDRNGEPLKDGMYCHPSLRLNVNGVRMWWAHKLASVGKGANRENALRNYIRNLRLDMYAQNIIPPDYIIGAHFHQRLYVPDAHRDHETKGFILPPYKAKDDYTMEGFAPFGLGDIGLHWVKVFDDGSSNWGWMSEEIEQIKEIKL